jgi:hypothetical protein
MRDTSLFLPDTISDALRGDLATGLRALRMRSTLGNLMANSSARVLQQVDDTTTDCTFASFSTSLYPSSKRSLSMVLH